MVTGGLEQSGVLFNRAVSAFYDADAKEYSERSLHLKAV
jgi:hypothetical protein